MVTRSLAAFSLVCLTLASASAGIYYEAVTTTQGKGGGGMGDVRVVAWVDGPNAKVEFTDSKNEMLKKGTYLLTTDGGKTIYLVSPKDKTYAVWDMDAMMQFVGGAMGMVKMTYSDPKVEKLLEEDGGLILGYPTTHYRYRTNYTVSMSVMGMRSTSQTVQERDTWSTTKISDAAMGIWLRAKPPKTGNEELDRLIESEAATMHGVPLKTVTVTTTTDQKKKAETSTVTTEVTTLKPMDIPSSTFVIPSDYKEAQLFPEAMPQEAGEKEKREEAPNPLRGLIKKPRL